jgi:vanillate O-demethylase monooxygenase subunit
VARSADVLPSAPVAVELLGEELVVYRGLDGRVVVLDDLCVHRGTRLSAGTVTDEGCIRCPYHGWVFAADGRCTLIPQAPELPIPPKAAVPAYRTSESAGLVWTCLASADDELAPRPEFPDAARPGWRTYAGEPMDWRCQATRQVENFLDIAHFSVLHTDVFGNSSALDVHHYDVTTSADGLEISATYDNYPALVPSPGSPERVPLAMSFDYQVRLPFSVRLVTSSPSGDYSLWSASSPVSATQTRFFWVMAAPEDFGLSDEMIELSEGLIFGPDRAVIEGQRPERLPLDLTAELHLPFDRLAVAYRRALARLGFP